MSGKIFTHENKIWWLWLPVLIMVAQICVEMTLSNQALSHLHSESGPHEFFEFLILLVAFIVAVRLLFKMERKKAPWLWLWVLIAAVCCFYVGGEEISWGQHLLKWSTPEYWAHFNDQYETNLHNTSSWLDQKPRLLLEIGVIVGGIIVPLLLRYKPTLLPARFQMIYPSSLLFVIAFMAIAPKLANNIFEMMGSSFFERVSEVQELYFFYFVLLYLLVLRKRLVENGISVSK